MHVRRNQSGFSTVEVLLVGLVLVVVAAVGIIVFHKNKTPVDTLKSSNTSKTSSQASNDNKQVLDAAYAYCATIKGADNQPESFFLNTSNASSVVYSENDSVAKVNGACYQKGTDPENATTKGTLVFTKTADGTWSFSKLVE